MDWRKDGLDLAVKVFAIVGGLSGPAALAMTYLQWRRDTRERVSVLLRVVRAEMGGVVTEMLLWQVTNNLDHQVQIRSLGIRANLARRDASPVVHQFRHSAE
jgi:hypothetical protein